MLPNRLELCAVCLWLAIDYRSLGIALHDCAVRESPCIIVQLGNCLA